ncbi:MULTISPECIES: HpcH/HpaI aldolase/citrate lyase family protein [unclassified Sphingomonas]|uniref:HpcH/HpaI aldolase/citrate lyase family protein n=1 Tax=unclassified Sphingomonas TaxID=196159 RepID=UPI0006F4CFEF|nr:MULTISPECIES: CoA ester lyase [unclassified Sphingomonas]KQM67001.1 citryl-CoA lyase [Sphingomonas sp. Leaf16]KQN17947.1 citryl-CoA lyase [Sphingomonas sp. Leaf29]KQN23811.1 citryl-CoA lyase [Sphingomonas sp. Leaf32]
MEPAITLAPRSVLFVPAVRPSMIAKAAGLSADLIVLDLEDSVRDGDKAAAREALPVSLELLHGRSAAVRINAPDTAGFADDLAAIGSVGVALTVVPKVESPDDLTPLDGRPVLAMIETPKGVLAAARIAATPGVVGLMVGTNDLAASLRLPPGAGRTPLSHALQAIVLAARAADGWAIDGVFNALNDADGLARECAEGRATGFDGKSLIHPDQIAIANTAFSPSTAELDEANAIVAAARGGAERFQDRMIEDMHVEMARRLLQRAR